MKIQQRSLFSDEGYYFHFPLVVFSEKKVDFWKDSLKIKEALEGRNVFYTFFDKKRKEMLIKRLASLKPLGPFILDYIKKKFKKVIPISIFVYGSYLYGDFDYLPEDIDVGVVVKGSFFKYFINKIKIPIFLRTKLVIPVEKISLFIYGEDNMKKGLPINDTIVAGLVHHETTLRELSVAYWRDVVIWGKDFNYLKDNERNILVTLTRIINGCYLRLLNRGVKKEAKNLRFKRIVTRLTEVIVFLKFLYPQLKVDKEYIFKLYREAVLGNVSYVKAKKFFDYTLILYQKTKQKLKILH
jgi:hypothetical protein